MVNALLGNLALAAPNSKPTVAEICATMLERPDFYSLVLKQDGSYDVLIKAVSPRIGLFGQESFTKLLSRTKGGRTVVRSLPELAHLKWTKSGRRLEYYSHPSGIFGKVIRYRLDSEHAIFALDINLQLGPLNTVLMGGLLKPFADYKATALVTGQRPSLTIERLELLRIETRSALRDFFRFLKENETNAAFAAAIDQADHI